MLQQQRLAEVPLSQRHDAAANQLSPLPPNLQNPAAYYTSKPTRLFHSTTTAWGYHSNIYKSDQAIKKSPLPKQLLPPLVINGEMPFSFHPKQQPDTLMNIRTLPSFSELEKDDPQDNMVGADSLPGSWDARGENTGILTEEQVEGMIQPMIHRPKRHSFFLCAAATAAAIEGVNDKEATLSAMMSCSSSRTSNSSQHITTSSNLVHPHSDLFISSAQNEVIENEDGFEGVLDSLVVGTCQSGDSHSSSLSSTSSQGLLFPHQTTTTNHGTNSNSGGSSTDEELLAEWDSGTHRQNSSSLFVTSPRSFLLGDRSAAAATTTTTTTMTTTKAW
jgi:hypothetical protein